VKKLSRGTRQFFYFVDYLHLGENFENTMLMQLRKIIVDFVKDRTWKQFLCYIYAEIIITSSITREGS